jgi:hypothetical protein
MKLRARSGLMERTIEKILGVPKLLVKRQASHQMGEVLHFFTNLALSFQ